MRTRSKFAVLFIQAVLLQSAVAQQASPNTDLEQSPLQRNPLTYPGLPLVATPNTAFATLDSSSRGLVQARHSLTVRVLSIDGGPVQNCHIVFWRIANQNTPAKADLWSLDRPSVWTDHETGKTWKPFFGEQVGGGVTTEDLAPGDWRVTASLENAVTPLGVSEIIHLGDTPSKRRVTIRLRAGCSLTVQAVDASDGRAVEWAQVLLVRDDGLPVTRWSDGPWALWMKNGRYRFEHLTPGTYWLVVGKVAGSFGEPEFTQDHPPVRVDLGAGADNVVKVRLNLATLGQEEIERRWPFVATGHVYDTHGHGLAGVTIRACCGSGTLIVAGTTMSRPDGAFLLHFGTGVGIGSLLANDFVLAAVISVEKLGYFEENLSRPGNLFLSPRAPAQKSLWYERRGQFVLPHHPYEMNFVMAPHSPP